ncbi:hypothetical protein BJ944DRAFT_284751 [Cunninghamella echinulata]|nr:hypothetical protein BJ944DRAFT_284751 [Cunninghamella echinulata]
MTSHAKFINPYKSREWNQIPDLFYRYTEQSIKVYSRLKDNDLTNSISTERLKTFANEDTLFIKYVLDAAYKRKPVLVIIALTESTEDIKGSNIILFWYDIFEDKIRQIILDQPLAGNITVAAMTRLPLTLMKKSYKELINEEHLRHLLVFGKDNDSVLVALLQDKESEDCVYGTLTEVNLPLNCPGSITALHILPQNVYDRRKGYNDPRIFVGTSKGCLQVLRFKALLKKDITVVPAQNYTEFIDYDNEPINYITCVRPPHQKKMFIVVGQNTPKLLDTNLSTEKDNNDQNDEKDEKDEKDDTFIHNEKTYLRVIEISGNNRRKLAAQLSPDILESYIISTTRIIPYEDYYQITAVFQSTIDKQHFEVDVWTVKDNKVSLDVAKETIETDIQHSIQDIWPMKGKSGYMLLYPEKAINPDEDLDEEAILPFMDYSPHNYDDSQSVVTETTDRYDTSEPPSMDYFDDDMQYHHEDSNDIQVEDTAYNNIASSIETEDQQQDINVNGNESDSALLINKQKDITLNEEDDGIDNGDKKNKTNYHLENPTQNLDNDMNNASIGNISIVSDHEQDVLTPTADNNKDGEQESQTPISDNNMDYEQNSIISITSLKEEEEEVEDKHEDKYNNIENAIEESTQKLDNSIDKSIDNEEINTDLKAYLKEEQEKENNDNDMEDMIEESTRKLNTTIDNDPTDREPLIINEEHEIQTTLALLNGNNKQDNFTSDIIINEDKIEDIVENNKVEESKQVIHNNTKDEIANEELFTMKDHEECKTSSTDSIIIDEEYSIISATPSIEEDDAETNINEFTQTVGDDSDVNAAGNNESTNEESSIMGAELEYQTPLANANIDSDTSVNSNSEDGVGSAVDDMEDEEEKKEEDNECASISSGVEDLIHTLNEDDRASIHNETVIENEGSIKESTQNFENDINNEYENKKLLTEEKQPFSAITNTNNENIERSTNDDNYQILNKTLPPKEYFQIQKPVEPTIEKAQSFTQRALSEEQDMSINNPSTVKGNQDSIESSSTANTDSNDPLSMDGSFSEKNDQHTSTTTSPIKPTAQDNSLLLSEEDIGLHKNDTKENDNSLIDENEHSNQHHIEKPVENIKMEEEKNHSYDYPPNNDTTQKVTMEDKPTNLSSSEYLKIARSTNDKTKQYDNYRTLFDKILLPLPLDIDNSLKNLETLQLDEKEETWLMKYCYEHEQAVFKLFIMHYNISHKKYKLVLMQNNFMNEQRHQIPNDILQTCNNLSRLAEKLVAPVLLDLPLDVFGDDNPFNEKSKSNLKRKRGLDFGADLVNQVIDRRKSRKIC